MASWRCLARQSTCDLLLNLGEGPGFCGMAVGFVRALAVSGKHMDAANEFGGVHEQFQHEPGSRSYDVMDGAEVG